MTLNDHVRPSTLAGLLLVLVATLLPRSLALDRFATPDERYWLRRSTSFYYAITEGKLADTFQAGHPGVPTTWAGALAFWLCCREHQDEIKLTLDATTPEDILTREVPVEPALEAYGYDPVDFLVKARLIVAVTVTVLLGLAFLAAARLLGVFPALLGCLLIAVDPFHLGLSRLLHVDALMAGFAFLSVLLLLNYMFAGSQRRFLVASAVAAGLACLAKIPALTLLPFLGLFWIGNLWHERRSGEALDARRVWEVTRPYALWGAICAATFVILWPAMWVDPIGVPWSIIRGTGKAVLLGHARGTFLAGEALAKRGHPGPLFYPINYLWRTSPVVLLGLLAFLAALATRRAVWRLPAERKSAVSLLLFAAVFLVVMTIGSKQIDRYLLPMFLPLDLVAGVGWILALRWLGSKLPAASRFLAPAVVGALLVSQGALAFTTAPYYLPYFNPLLGGPKRAVEMVLVGWGEGLDQAARYLNGKPGSKDLTVMSWYGDGPFSYFFDGKALQYDDSVIAKVMAPEAAEANGSNLDTPDYVVLYVNQWQRDLAPAALLARRPEHVVRLAGVEYARIYSVQSEDSGNSPGN